MRAPDFFALALLGQLATALPALAQAPPKPPARANGELELVFEREVFVYPGAGRRDPFAALVGAGFGPRFEDLTLQGIIYSRSPDRSVALLVDSEGEIHRVRRGDVVGNARITGIAPMRVVFAVENFGVIRQEQLELKKEPEGAKG